MAPPVAGYFAWYDVSRIVGGVNGSAISPWPDLSGNGYDLTTSSVAAVYRVNQLNGLPGVEFSGASMQTSAFTAVTAGTVFIVANSVQTDLYNYLFDGIAETNRWAMGYQIITHGDMSTYAGGLFSGYAESVPSGFAQWTATFAGDASSVLRKNGVNQFTADVGAQSLTGITLGNNFNGGDLGSLSDVKICEAIYYPSVLSTPDIASVESYLNTKWFVAPVTQKSSMLFTFT